MAVMISTELANRVCVTCNQEKPETEYSLLARDNERHGMQICAECHALGEAETRNKAPDNWPRPRRMLNEKQVLEIVPVGRSTLWRMEKAGRFPRSTYISPNRRIWFEDEIIAWQTAIAECDPHFDPARGRGKGRRKVRQQAAVQR
ncbi:MULTISPECIES: AlpA family phage regulatory protein [unclassified Bradyrhizobium]|uniref:helix-turn-helix transcriptional regulator n=1 Tax=unclassified Bradyrhizobium TaxID=2631580 RepID=UPI001FF81C60|nr:MULTISPECIES: AlpA family phage regulatory protein [unclassified Bradyrhizobium]MCK1669675.1 AlpA family phage regulatory protein [Bradyrhizobium sp. 153]MCK1757515.1 AlpA family phage regulatory protein [Bradyrhizobium sp. 137]